MNERRGRGGLGVPSEAELDGLYRSLSNWGRWGEDDEAAKRRQARQAELDGDVRFFELVRG